jgi:heterodisulfide reductase subunit A2
MTPNDNVKKVDVLVIGGGIAGLQVATDLADQGIDVLIVEKTASIGGKMIALSKVFPTLDCASCITTPKMAETAHHPNIEIMTLAEVDNVEKLDEGNFSCDIIQHPRRVIAKDCIGCRQCEYACPILVPDDFEGDMGARKAIYIPHTNAYPQLALVDIDSCTFCGKCIRACPTDAIDFMQQEEQLTIETGSVVVTTGFEMTPIDAKSQYGSGKHSNVISPLLMERILAPHGPYGKVMRPSDGMIPDSIAYVQCAGSRDASIGVPYCSRVCCMYAIKQAILLSGSLPFADITIYYMDIRAFGKGYEQFYQDAKAMGINFVCGKVASITEDENHNPIIRVEKKEEGAVVQEDQHDLVVLSLGMTPGWNPERSLNLTRDRYGFVECRDEKVCPGQTTTDGIFVAGTAVSPKDIVDTIVEAGAAATRVAIYLQQSGYLEQSALVAEKV